ncbi:MAG: mechanosensitive ion channel [bacterium]|nr:mechanosensitive ion channel [bacterium]
MSDSTWFVVEVLVMLSIYGLASVLTSRLRRSARAERGAGSALLHLLRGLAGCAARPVMVLLVSQAVLMLLDRMPEAAAWLRQRPQHLDAWRMFWLGVLAVELIEGLAVQAYALRRRTFPIPDLLLDIIRFLFVLAVGFAVMKLQMGVDIAPLLASTALLTAVVGFALQGVLGNLLAGMSLHLVGSFRAGQWISIGDLEGHVVGTNWRETQVRTRAGHYITVPNAKVAESLIHNMEQPNPVRRHSVTVGASYSDAPDEVLAALLAAARSVPDVRPNPAPAAMIVGFMDFGINYRLDFWTTQFYKHSLIDGEVNRMIWYQFKRRGIEIPFPMSDKLLNDFMTVVNGQRRLEPEDRELAARLDDLLGSDLCTKLVVDAEGRPLLDREALAQVAPLLRRLPYTRGETVFVQGEAGDTFHVVVRGKLAVRVAQDADVAAEFVLGPGAVVGEMSLMTGAPRSATVTVTESTELLEFDLAAFRAILSLRDEIPEALATLAAKRAAQNRTTLDRLSQEHEAAAGAEVEHHGILHRLLAMIGR